MQRRRLRVTGTVQGVGFRPFVYRQALELGLTGHVSNDSAGVLVEVEGDASALDELSRRLRTDAPPLARVQRVDVTVVSLVGDDRFAILASSESGPPAAAVSIDSATCQDCLAEVADPADRRYRYPFTNCTNCGPRYTIITAVPYDRPSTTMAGFVMCAHCQREYDDPADRRFHAQPNACPACGPRLSFCRQDGTVVAEGDNALVAAVAALRTGRILAIKGVGGFHLATDATDEAAVAALRRRKSRDDKPFAVMVADLASARRLASLDAAGEEALCGLGRPVVLAERAADANVASGVAPGLPELGVILPYTALHHLVLQGVGRPLVMTSGNVSDEPIAHTDEDALSRLGGLVDGFLTNDRPIHIRCDDSVVRATRTAAQVLRRSRGFSPEPLALPGMTSGCQVLAVGAELKSTVAVAKDGWVVASHHIGDLEHLANHRSFLQAIDHLCRVFGVAPDVVAHDLHPEYLSTKWAEDVELPTLAVQHHHAHIASCLADNGHLGPVLGLAFDGLGFGLDSTLWGGEFLVADMRGFERVGCLKAVPLPGGAAAIREPWRMALSWAASSLGTEAAMRLGERLDARYPAVLALVDSGLSPETTSMGRLFDAVAAMLGVRSRVSYEGQAAIELEALARRIDPLSAPRYPVARGSLNGLVTLDPAPLLATVLAEQALGTAPALIAAGFHRGIGEAAADLAADLAGTHGLETVALSGGVFQNVRLSAVIVDALKAHGLRVLVHHLVPPNDGGISIGQAAIASLAGH